MEGTCAKILETGSVVSLLPAKRVMHGLGGTGTGPIRRCRALWGRFHFRRSILPSTFGDIGPGERSCHRLR